MELVAFAVFLVIAIVVAVAGWQRLPIRVRGRRAGADPPPEE